MGERVRQESPELEATQQSLGIETEPLPKIRDFLGVDILSAEQFDRSNLEIIFHETERMKRIVEQKRMDDSFDKYLLATLFYEPSTRTRLSFEAAMQRLGGRVISESSIQFSSVIKGEVLPDTIRVVEGYVDVIALRHHEVGSAKIAADLAQIPVINAGDGHGEHPTQALLDLYTIKQKFGEIDGLSITFLGDLKFGRTVHSLAKLLSHYKVQMNFVAPEYLQIRDDIISDLETKGIEVNKCNRLDDVNEDSDIIYVTRLQEERFDDDQFGQVKLTHLKGSYDLPKDFPEKFRALIMHPLPRINEVPMEIDKSPNAIYFEQSKNGIFVRMALLKLVLKGHQKVY